MNLEPVSDALKNLMREQVPNPARLTLPVKVPQLRPCTLPRRGAVLILQGARRMFAGELKQTHPHLNRADRRRFASQIAFA